MNSSPPQHLDSWASGAAYEPYVGRWSRLVAQEVIAWLAVAARPPLARRRLRHRRRRRDHSLTRLRPPPSPASISRKPTLPMPAPVSKTRARRLSWAICKSLPFVDASLRRRPLRPRPQLRARPAACRRASWRRVVRPGGTVAVYLWDYAGEMQFMRHFWDAAAALDPAAPDEGSRFPICRPEPLKALFTVAGLQNVDVRAVDIPTVFRDFDDFWSPFLGGQGAAPRYAMALPETARAALREHLRASLPTAADGSISLIARAWAARLGERAVPRASLPRRQVSFLPSAFRPRHVAQNTPWLCPP